MRRLNNKDAKTVEKRYFDAAPVIRTYFNDVVTVDGFIMSVDETGVYFFTTIEDHNKILVKLSNYMNQLALSKKDMVVCYLGWEVAPITDDVFFKRIPDHRFQDLLFVEINPDTFEPSLRLLLSSRTAILKRDDIIDIIECYQNSTIMQGSLYEFMQARGFNLDRHLVESLEESPLVNLDDIINDFGEESAVEIYNAISEFRDAQDRQVIGNKQIYRSM